MLPLLSLRRRSRHLSPLSQTSGQGINARGVRGVEPRSCKSCQMYPRTSPLTTNFSIRGKGVCDIFRFTVDVIDRLRHRMLFH
jgi:hypothetical protein